jgi:hypothetical protein
VERKPLLVVALEIGRDLADLAARKLQHFEDRLGPHAPDVGDRLAVGGHDGGRGAAELSGHRDRLAVPAIEPLDLPDPLVDVAVVAVARIARGEVDEAAVLRERRVRGVGLLVFLRELDAAAPFDVPHPQLDGPQARAVGQSLASDQVVAVGGPGGTVDRAVFFGRDRAGVLTVRVADPEVFDAAAVGGERNPLSVGRKARLHVEGAAAGDARGFAAADRDRVQVSHQGKDDR